MKISKNKMIGYLKYYALGTLNKLFKKSIIPNQVNTTTWDELLKIHNFKEINSINDVAIISYYQPNIPPSIIEYQKLVFNCLGLNVFQHQSTLSHANFLNEVIPSYLNYKYLICFDIDCVPLSKNCFISILKDIEDHNTLAGAIQTANHKLDGKNNYVGPFFMAFSAKLYSEIGPIDFNPDKDHDVGGQFTTQCLKNNKKIKYWFPTFVEKPKWKLFPYGYFGIGTVYNGLVFHNFEIRINYGIPFKKICKSILKGKYQ